MPLLCVSFCKSVKEGSPFLIILVLNILLFTDVYTIVLLTFYDGIHQVPIVHISSHTSLAVINHTSTFHRLVLTILTSSHYCSHENLGQLSGAYGAKT